MKKESAMKQRRKRWYVFSSAHNARESTKGLKVARQLHPNKDDVREGFACDPDDRYCYLVWARREQ